MNFLYSSLEALHTSRRERSQLAKEGRNYVYLNLASEFIIHEKTRFFYMPQSWDMGQMFYFPSEERHAENFFNRRKSDGFGRERTRDLGYERPSCLLLLLARSL
jgi:hypothetical protein